MEEMNAAENINIPLTLLNTNDTAKIITVRTSDNLKLRKLTAFGILPGLDVKVIQKYPAVVVQVGFTQIALDDDIAGEIIVNKQGDR